MKRYVLSVRCRYTSLTPAARHLPTEPHSDQRTQGEIGCLMFLEHGSGGATRQGDDII